MPVPTPSGALTVAFRCALSALPSGQSPWDPVPRLCLVPDQFEVWLPWFLGEEFAALLTAEEAIPLIPANVAAAATEANRVALLAAQSMPQFRSESERDLYEEARATRAALESGFAMTNSVIAAPSPDRTGERPCSLAGVGGCCGQTAHCCRSRGRSDSG
ncbi:hypothetical protein GMDG_06691 [Pseudogymnoascus destructans 20631-21]|uniref:Uncharacterized protein n=1 Tax=Pseudogymnoascus destructans (strain ATCC MYA-4855 / 20631-21) TaxID=658429 RepID=L8FTT6_PSED2|nr:hypothetical protein GMDG_06691 [Pseudogymnoascus destructans 20631-21]